ncbi:IS110 family transposase [Listeria rocourtiae]|uniref:transposase n=1 Tax=Listeria rocourtiae TaxID=647910 RepID=UPI0016248249|nr:transposase [Listeria rocourtiae]MBC1605365.1 IS110 family transposase [Listeria rocourtiae]
MSIFPSSKHLASWEGFAPGNHESAGKNYNARIRQGNVYLKTCRFVIHKGEAFFAFLRLVSTYY